MAPKPRCSVARPMAVNTGIRSSLTALTPRSTAASKESPETAGHGETIVNECQMKCTGFQGGGDILVVAQVQKTRIRVGVPPRTRVVRAIGGLQEAHQEHLPWLLTRHSSCILSVGSFGFRYTHEAGVLGSGVVVGRERTPSGWGTASEAIVTTSPECMSRRDTADGAGEGRLLAPALPGVWLTHGLKLPRRETLGRWDAK